MSSEILAALFGAILAGGFAIWTAKGTLNDSLDSKSDWRKNLFDIASKPEITLEDVYRVRASVRYKKHGKISEPFSFNWMTDFIIIFCDFIIDNHNRLQNYNLIYEVKSKVQTQVKYRLTPSNSLNQKYQEILRILCRYLLKHHWEYNRHILFRSYFYNDKQSGKETMEMVYSKMKKSNDTQGSDRGKSLSTLLDDYFKSDISLYESNKTYEQRRKNNKINIFKVIFLTDLIAIFLFIYGLYNLSNENTISSIMNFPNYICGIFLVAIFIYSCMHLPAKLEIGFILVCISIICLSIATYLLLSVPLSFTIALSVGIAISIGLLINKFE